MLGTHQENTIMAADSVVVGVSWRKRPSGVEDCVREGRNLWTAAPRLAMFSYIQNTTRFSLSKPVD
jgi:hypothetical protein